MIEPNATRCECGAVTLLDEDVKTPFCVSEDKLSEFYDLSNIQFTENTYVNCNHCVNHWGLDLCECGSGQEPEYCCGQPMQDLSEAFNQ